MEKRRKTRPKSKAKAIWTFTAILGIICLLCCAAAAGIMLGNKEEKEKPEKLLEVYMNYISKKEYEKMYQMTDLEISGNLSQEDFITRNSKIYEGIEMENMKLANLRANEGEDGLVTVSYETIFDTLAGEVWFENQAVFTEEEDGYRLKWNDSVIHPDLEAGDKVRVVISQAKRGNILDRNGKKLAGEGAASSVGVVPGRLEDKKASLEQMAELLEIEAGDIEKKLSAGWVKDDSFVPIKTIPKVKETDLLKNEPDKEILKEKARQDQLLEIPGVMISDVAVREYPLKNAAAHLTGYVQNVTAEDLEKHAGEGYHANSVIGKSGIEGLYEKELKGENGCEIYIADSKGNKKSILADILKKDGQDVKLTIDAALQSQLYEQFKEDKSCTAAMNPYTGEILALLSTPSFDNNDFIMGLSNEKWKALNEDEDKPMYNRFRQLWCPGSVFKPIIGAIGLKTGAVSPGEDFGNSGLSWQKDASWGDYYVTTLHGYAPAVLENALIYSDNIYFAKAALKIGAKDLTAALDWLGFNQKMPFEITLKESQYSNTDKIESEVQLADSGYGQGQVLVNPVHLASLYTSFVNDGNVIKPYLLYDEEAKKEIWIKNAFPEKAAGQILEGLKKVVNDPHGTGYFAHREDMVLAGKTGTAEIKASKADNSGTELGWFAAFTTKPDIENPILIVSVAEDVKEIGGSGYVVRKVKNILDLYFDQ